MSVGLCTLSDVDAEILAILKRLESALDNRFDPVKASTIRFDFDGIRRGVGRDVEWHQNTDGIDSPLALAQRLVRRFHLPDEARKTCPGYYKTFNDVARLLELVETWTPRLCHNCREVEFMAPHVDETWCDTCRAGRGRMLGLHTALRCAPNSLDEFPNWPTIQHLACELFGHPTFDERTWERLVGWLLTEHVPSRKEFLMMMPSAVVELLRKAVGTGQEISASARLAGSGTPAKPKREKRSHGKGGARLKINGGLTTHHQYANGKCGRYEPVQVNVFAKAIGVSPGSVSAFLNKAFGDYDAYVGACRQRTTLDTKLTVINADFATLKTAGGNPLARAEGDRDDD